MARKRKASRPLGRMVGQVFGMLWKLVWGLPVAFLILSCLWVLAYRWVDPPTTFLIGRDSRAGILQPRAWVPLSRLPRHIPRSAIAAEDGNFCLHQGFDTEAIRQAMLANAEGEKLRGGSTISQQTVKNVFLWPERSWLRKGMEAYFTLLTELMWPKPRIMEVYLNVIEWGPGVYGIEAAARHHFDKPADTLTQRQAARLMSILPSPLKWRAAQPGPFVRRKARRVQRWARVMPGEFTQCVDSAAKP